MISYDDAFPVIRRDWTARISDIRDSVEANRPLLADRYGDWYVESYELPDVSLGSPTSTRVILRLAIQVGGLSAGVKELFEAEWQAAYPTR